MLKTSDVLRVTLHWATKRFQVTSKLIQKQLSSLPTSRSL